jgi:ribonuclease BN (tRNA processing enzyme)
VSFMVGTTLRANMKAGKVMQKQHVFATNSRCSAPIYHGNRTHRHIESTRTTHCVNQSQYRHPKSKLLICRAKTTSDQEQQEQQQPQPLPRPANLSQVTALPPKGKFSYRQIKSLQLDVIKAALTKRNLSTIGRGTQLASRLYSALIAEERALTADESIEIDAVLDTEMYTAADTDDGSSETEEETNSFMSAQPSLSGANITSSQEERIVSNSVGLQVSFLNGGPGKEAPNGIKTSTSLLVRSQRSIWLFDCGEDTQRSFIGHPLVEWKRIERIFISSMSPDNVLGLPGMLCTISASRAKGHENADYPVHVYGPKGLIDFVNTTLSVSNTYLEMPVVIHEFTPRPLTTPEQQEAIDKPILINQRSMLYATYLPPDQLNPRGYYDGELQAMLARHTQKRQNSRMDGRSGALSLEMPPPGDPKAAATTPVSSMTWTIRIDGEYSVSAGALRHTAPCFGYLIREAPRAGKLNMDRARAMGLEEGSAQLQQLKQGVSVTNGDGKVVHPAECVAPPRPGRRIAVIGPCIDSIAFARRMKQMIDRPVELVVHALSTPSGDAAVVLNSKNADSSSRNVSLASMAGKCAAVFGAKELTLWQQSSLSMLSPEAKDGMYPYRVLKEAKMQFNSEDDDDGEGEEKYVSIGGVYEVHQIERPPAPPAAWESEEHS